MVQKQIKAIKKGNDHIVFLSIVNIIFLQECKNLT